MIGWQEAIMMMKTMEMIIGLLLPSAFWEVYYSSEAHTKFIISSAAGKSQAPNRILWNSNLGFIVMMILL